MKDQQLRAVLQASALVAEWADVLPEHPVIPVLRRIARVGAAQQADVPLVLNAVLELARLAETPPPTASGGASTLQHRAWTLLGRLPRLSINGHLTPLGIEGLEWACRSTKG